MMRKVFIILTFIILIVIVSSLYLSYVNVKEKEFVKYLREDINRLLVNKEYDNAFLMLNNQENTYREILQKEIDIYTKKLCEEAITNLSRDILLEYKFAGGNYPDVNSAIEKIAEEEKQIENLKISAQSYDLGLNYFKNRQFKDARNEFEKIIIDDKNYQSAQNYLAELDIRDLSWGSGLDGRLGYANACTYDGEYAYVPFVLDGIDGIYKISADGDAEDFFPLSDEESVLYIGGINVIGEYLYFIAGEKVGSGYTFDSPYCIYEMKTDGTNLCLVLEGNFIDLYIRDDRVYAISRELGLVQYSKDFILENIISDGIISEFSFSENGIYYTLQSDFTHSNINLLYFYDYKESKLIDDARYLHHYQFDYDYIEYWKRNSVFESLNFGNESKKIKFREADIYKVYGILGSQILYSCNGSLGRETMYIYNINNGITDQLNEKTELLEYKINSMFYERAKTVIEKDNKLYFTDIKGENRQEIVNIEVDNDMLEINASVINHMQSDDIYTDSGDTKIISVIYDKQNWHYKDDKLNVTIEKRYIDEYDTNVYVTHIFTTDYSLLTTGNANPESLNSRAAYSADIISAVYQTIFAQNTDLFLHNKNVEKGIIIRHGRIVRDIFLKDMIVLFEDGSAEVYKFGDEVNTEMLIEKGAVTSFSFGPILVKDYNVDTDCVNAYPAQRNPRSAIGYVEPGHYVLIACDGRDSEVSRGLTMIQLARIFEDEGCKLAYNLDGGMSTAVLFMGNYVTNRPKYGTSEWFFYRRIAEIFYVGTNEWSPADLSKFECDYNYFAANYKQ